MKKTLFLFLELILSANILFSREQYVYTQISQKEGLTSTINSIYKEKDGDIWIGSQNGLFRFNGNSLYHYSSESFKGKIIYETETDSEGNLWVLTNDWLLVKKAGEEDFSILKPEQQKRSFYCMQCDDKGVWFGSLGCIYRYEHSTKDLKVFCNLEKYPTFIVRDILKPVENHLMCCSHNGIILIDSKTGTVSESSIGSRKEISASLIDSKGRLWLAFYNNGIEVYSPDGTKLKTYRSELSGLSSNIVLCMTERNSSIWAGTDGGGVNIIDPETDCIKVLSHVAGDPSSLPAHSVKSIYTDHNDNIWVGSIRDGLISISESQMNMYSDVHLGLDTGLSNPTVLCLYQDIRTEDIWIGTDGEGINRFTPSTNRFRHFDTTLKTKVVSIASYSTSELVISVYGDRIWIFNKDTGKMTPLVVSDTELEYQMKYAGRSINVYNENDGTLLILGNSVRRYYRKTESCHIIPTSDGAKAVGTFLPAGRSADGIWLHDNNKLYFLKEKAGQADLIATIDENIILRCGDTAPDGNLWFATSDGLYRFDRKEHSFNKIHSTLIQEAVNVVCDNSSRVWVGTHDHLYAYIPETESFAMFGPSDGAAPNEYLSKPHLLAKNGDVFMGGVQGLLSIDSRYEIDRIEVPVIKLYDVMADHARLSANSRGRYILPRHTRGISIELSVLEKDIFRDKRYRFSFSGKGGIYETSEPVLNLRTLPQPGRYVISVSCTRRDGEWTEPVNLTEMTIPQPWFLSLWFILSCALLVVAAFLSFYISSRRRRIEKIELVRKEQEHKAYEEKVQMLINISHELRTPLTLIMAPMKRILKSHEPGEKDYTTLSRIYRQSRRMKDMLNMVLDLRKMEMGKNRLNLETVDTYKWIMDVAGDTIEEGRSEGIEFLVNVAPEADRLKIDTQKCETVLTNILMNGIKHSKSGDTISINAETHNDMIRISVSDQGPGLGDINMDQMFTRFYQSNSEKYGSGIGLSYSKILVELHGGNIGTYNNEDKGATFWWEVPQNPCFEFEDVPARAYLNELMGYNPGLDIVVPECETFSTQGIKLMLVDDNNDLLDFLRESLSGEFGEIITANSGNSAFKDIQSGKLPDIIVSDVNMPDGDGYRLCNTIKNDERYSHIPVILLTARGEEQSQSDSYKIGADGFIAKPFDIETLLELIRGLMKRRAEIRKKYLDNSGNGTAEYGSSEEAFIIKFNKVVSEHMSDPDLDQQLICRELGVSRALLYNKMKAIIGTGAKEYITRVRIEKAKSLMENPSLSIAEISEMTGFTSQSYFSTAFKNQTGMTPSQYRQNGKS